MTVVLSPALRLANLQAFVDALDGGSVVFYGGTRPAFGTLTGLDPQASIPLGSPAATVDTGAVTATLQPPTGQALEGIRSAADPITWARFQASDGTPCSDCDVSSSLAATGDILLTSVTGIVGAFVEITGGVIAG